MTSNIGFENTVLDQDSIMGDASLQGDGVAKSGY
jgi:hypothetical protein